MSIAKVMRKWQGEDMFFGKINQNSRFTYLRTIENGLSGADWQIVLNGPFGPIVKMMMNYRIYAQVIHHLLFRQVQCNKKFETWYDLGGNCCRFSMKEFSLISGLNCGVPEEEDMDDEKGAVQELFGTPAIKISQLLHRFIAYREDNMFKLKMALLLILEGIVLGQDKKKNIRNLHVKLIQDMDRFNNFPWGRSAYLELHDSLANSIDTRQESVAVYRAVDKTYTTGYTIKGLPMIFQV